MSGNGLGALYTLFKACGWNVRVDPDNENILIVEDLNDKKPSKKRKTKKEEKSKD